MESILETIVKVIVYGITYPAGLYVLILTILEYKGINKYPPNKVCIIIILVMFVCLSILLIVLVLQIIYGFI